MDEIHHLTADNEYARMWCGETVVMWMHDEPAKVNCRECLRAAAQFGISCVERLAELKRDAS